MPVTDQPQDYTWGKRKNLWKILLAVGGGLVLIAAVVGFVVFSGGNDEPAPTNVGGTGETLLPRVIDGVNVPRGQENIFPVAVIVENLVTVRPQSGLASANVVYEALAEGGITRFLAVYASADDVPEIGPVRSARPYFVDWTKEYDALFVHEGGSPQALADIRNLKINDLYAGLNSRYYWRDSKRSTAFEHTLFTSSRLLAFARRDKNLSEKGAYASWPFKADAPLAERPLEPKTITIDFSSFNYKVEYRYEAEKNVYVRTQGGVEQKDRAGTILTAKNVVVIFVKTRLIDTERLGMDTTGTGQAMVFRDGQRVDGTWKKDSPEDRTEFLDADGKPITLTAGTTWIEVVPSDRTVGST